MSDGPRHQPEVEGTPTAHEDDAPPAPDPDADGSPFPRADTEEVLGGRRGLSAALGRFVVQAHQPPLAT